MTFNKLYLILSLYLSCIFCLKGQETPVTLTENDITYEIIDDHISLFIDTSNTLTIDDILQNETNIPFKIWGKSFPSITKIDYTYWLRFRIKNECKKEKLWLLEAFDPKTSFLALYEINEDHFSVQQAGNELPFSAKMIEHKNYTFQIDIPYQSERVYYLKVKSSYPAGLHYVVRSHIHFTSYALNEYFYLGLFYGILFLMVIYNLSVFINTKEKKYVYYVLYVISISIFSMCWDGFGFQYLWPNNPELNKYIFAVALYSSITWTILFANDFLELHKRLPKLSKLLKGYIFFRGLFLLCGLLIYRELLFMLYLDIIPLLLVYISGIIVLKNRYKPARFFVLSYSVLFIGFILFVGENLRITSNDLIFIYALNGGVLLEAFFLSLALTDRLRVEIKGRQKAYEESIQNLVEKRKLSAQVIKELEEKEKLKDKVNRELEEKVAERTKALTVAHEQLSDQKRHIEAISQELDKQNWGLKKEIKDMEKSLIINKFISFQEFVKIFPDNETCNQFIYKLKEDHGFVCKKCGAAEYVKGPSSYSRRCTNCNYVETITANTIFHNLKFPLNKAFYLLYTYVTLKKNIAVTALAKEIELRPNTCWSFKKKIEDTQKNLKKTEADSWEKLIFNG